jgi:hypothetical protein
VDEAMDLMKHLKIAVRAMQEGSVFYKQLLRKRGELIERTFAHCYETGGMRRTHLRKHNNILKRLLIHVAGANLGLLLRSVYGKGTPRGLQGLSVTLHFLIALIEQNLKMETGPEQSATVTYDGVVPPSYHPGFCVHSAHFQTKKLISATGC